MTQMTLEDHIARGKARRTDPEPSHDAAGALVASGALGRQQAAVLARVARSPGSTSHELAAGNAAARYMIARRLPELARLGLVLRGSARTCRVTGRTATTWRVNRPGDS